MSCTSGNRRRIRGDRRGIVGPSAGHFLLQAKENGMKKPMVISLVLLLMAAGWIYGEGRLPLPLPDLLREIEARFGPLVPRQWGEQVSGVKMALDTDQRVIALTFDACGGPGGKGYDASLMEFLTKEQVPATLFFSGLWIEANPEIFHQLARQSLLEIENHGSRHQPCSVNGRSAYGIQGTASLREVVEEIEGNARKIEALTGRRPKYYRSGTAYYDEVAVAIANALGHEVVNFTVLGDGGARYSKDQVRKVLLRAPPQSIVILHMNHPEGETAEGVMEAIPLLRGKGIRFVRLDECRLR